MICCLRNLREYEFFERVDLSSLASLQVIESRSRIDTTRTLDMSVVRLPCAWVVQALGLLNELGLDFIRVASLRSAQCHDATCNCGRETSSVPPFVATVSALGKNSGPWS